MGNYMIESSGGSVGKVVGEASTKRLRMEDELNSPLKEISALFNASYQFSGKPVGTMPLAFIVRSELGWGDILRKATEIAGDTGLENYGGWYAEKRYYQLTEDQERKLRRKETWMRMRSGIDMLLKITPKDALYVIGFMMGKRKLGN
jgi:hypothetical protein